MTDETSSPKSPANISQSNELTEAAYYLPLQAKRVLWLALMQCYKHKTASDECRRYSQSRLQIIKRCSGSVSILRQLMYAKEFPRWLTAL